jgi:hypothetical protein
MKKNHIRSPFLRYNTLKVPKENAGSISGQWLEQSAFGCYYKKQR